MAHHQSSGNQLDLKLRRERIGKIKIIPIIP